MAEGWSYSPSVVISSYADEIVHLSSTQDYTDPKGLGCGFVACSIHSSYEVSLGAAVLTTDLQEKCI